VGHDPVGLALAVDVMIAYFTVYVLLQATNRLSVRVAHKTTLTRPTLFYSAWPCCCCCGCKLNGHLKCASDRTEWEEQDSFHFHRKRVLDRIRLFPMHTLLESSVQRTEGVKFCIPD
jgi:hypothetical protein